MCPKAAKPHLFIGSFSWSVSQQGRSCNSCLCTCGWVHIKTVLIHLAQLSDAGSIGSRTCDEKSDRHNHKPLREFINTFYFRGGHFSNIQLIVWVYGLRVWVFWMQLAAVFNEKDLINPHYATCQSANSRKVESATSWWSAFERQNEEEPFYGFKMQRLNGGSFSLQETKSDMQQRVTCEPWYKYERHVLY